MSKISNPLLGLRLLGIALIGLLLAYTIMQVVPVVEYAETGWCDGPDGVFYLVAVGQTEYQLAGQNGNCVVLADAPAEFMGNGNLVSTLGAVTSDAGVTLNDDYRFVPPSDLAMALPGGVLSTVGALVSFGGFLFLFGALAREWLE